MEWIRIIEFVPLAEYSKLQCSSLLSTCYLIFSGCVGRLNNALKGKPFQTLRLQLRTRRDRENVHVLAHTQPHSRKLNSQNETRPFVADSQNFPPAKIPCYTIYTLCSQLYCLAQQQLQCWKLQIVFAILVQAYFVPLCY